MLPCLDYKEFTSLYKKMGGKSAAQEIIERKLNTVAPEGFLLLSVAGLETVIITGYGEFCSIKEQPQNPDDTKKYGRWLKLSSAVAVMTTESYMKGKLQHE